MVYMDTNESNTHADPPQGNRWAQMWVHMWAQTLVIFLVYITKGNTHTPKVYANTKPKSLHNNDDKYEIQMVDKVTFLHCGA